MGSNIVWNNKPYLGWSDRAFLLVKKDLNFASPDWLSYDTLLWQPISFRNYHSLSYFAPRLIRLGIYTVGQVLEDSSLFRHMAPTWEPTHRKRLLGLTQPPTAPLSSVPPPTPSIPVPELTFWSQWIRSSVAELLSGPHTLKPRQPDEVWSVFWDLKLPVKQKDFVHQALWSRLPVGQRQSAWKPLEVWCPLVCEVETVQHNLFSCQDLIGAFDIIDTAFRSQNHNYTSVKSLLQDDTVTSLSTPAGLL